jgi:hypothetical protein
LQLWFSSRGSLLRTFKYCFYSALLNSWWKSELEKLR